MQFSYNSNNLSWGFSLLSVGIIFLLSNLGVLDADLNNWWAIFILMPGFNMLLDSWKISKKDSQKNLIQNTSFIPGIFLTALGFSFLLDFNWEIFFPIALIVVGISLLTRRNN